MLLVVLGFTIFYNYGHKIMGRGDNLSDNLIITSSVFKNNGTVPKKYTGFGEDISPDFFISNLNEETVSIAIIMDDLDIPMLSSYNHWIIWNIPKTEYIPENIPYGSTVPSLSNAIQGTAYGKNRYRGPKQPPFVKSEHRYIFNFYSLDCFLDLGCKARKKDLLKTMQGHILQQGNILFRYKR